MLLITLLLGILIMWPDVTAAPLLLAMLPIAILGPVLFHVTAKTLWIAIDLSVNPLEPGEALGGPEERAAQQG